MVSGGSVVYQGVTVSVGRIRAAERRLLAGHLLNLITEASLAVRSDFTVLLFLGVLLAGLISRWK